MLIISFLVSFYFIFALKFAAYGFFITVLKHCCKVYHIISNYHKKPLK